MNPTWILTGDSSRVRIFEKKDKENEITEVEDYANPRGRADNRALVSDALGRRSGGNEGAHAHAIATSDNDQVDHETELFSKNICEALDKARGAQRFDKLYLIAPPRFLGLSRKNLSKDVNRLVQKEIA